MNTRIKPTILAIAIPALAAVLSGAANAGPLPGTDCYYESQYGVNNPYCGNYKSEISPARAFADTVATRGKWGKPSQQPVIIDVRSTPEYRAGHPEHAYNVPYPYIYQYCNDVGDAGPQDDRQPDGACKSGGARIPQPDEDFADYVEHLIPNKDTPIYTLCRTGHRSVGAAHVLADAGYTNVRNIWEGFVGLFLTTYHFALDQNGDMIEVVDPKAPGAPPNAQWPVSAGGDDKYYEVVPANADLNHDGVVNDLDKNGWRYHQELPYDTRLLPPLIYKPDAETYYWD
jgi:rhodanese-related sulfurtransferase